MNVDPYADDEVTTPRVAKLGSITNSPTDDDYNAIGCQVYGASRSACDRVVDRAVQQTCNGGIVERVSGDFPVDDRKIFSQAVEFADVSLDRATLVLGIGWRKS